MAPPRDLIQAQLSPGCQQVSHLLLNAQRIAIEIGQLQVAGVMQTEFTILITEQGGANGG